MAPAALLRGVGDLRLEGIRVGGSEQVMHNVAYHLKIPPFDLSRAYRCRIEFRPLAWFAETDEIVHPLKDFGLMHSLPRKLKAAAHTLGVRAALPVLARLRPKK